VDGRIGPRVSATWAVIVIGICLRALPFVAWVGAAAVLQIWLDDRTKQIEYGVIAFLICFLFFPYERVAGWLFDEPDGRDEATVKWARPSPWRTLRYYVIWWKRF